MAALPEDSPFPVRFAGRLRPSQTEAAAVAARQLSAGQKRIHIVAPPGSGKTVLGLYLWAEHVRRPAVVLSPNSAIQAQWAARTSLFEIAAGPETISTDGDRPGLLTSLTYQSVTLPRRRGEDLDAEAARLWRDKLIASGQAEDPDEAWTWIDDLAQHNPDYYNERLAAYRKQVRDELAMGGEALETLHQSALAALRRLRDRGVGLVILDECHHLMGHWGRVLADARELLVGPVVIGLTATPPDRAGKAPEDVQRYDEFFGPVDYETPVPAVVKDGFLSPYQDLVCFVRPTAEELKYLATADRGFRRLVDAFCHTGRPEPGEHRCEESLMEWLCRVLAERRLPTGTVSDFGSFERRDPALADAGRRFLLSRREPLPAGVPEPPPTSPPEEPSEIDLLVPVLDRYIRHRLRRSPDVRDHQLAERAIAQLALLGVQISEAGPRACASPVGRVMGYSRAKAGALLDVLKAEQAVLGERIRAVVITDYEKTSAVTAEIAHLLDEEAGGAIAAFRALLGDEQTDRLDPVLVTGSTVLVDDDLLPRFLERAGAWLARRRIDLRLTHQEQEGFFVVSGEGRDWCPRVYVEMITELFQEGVTKCLVGTRGLLGEGWDAHKVNVLVNLTTVTTSMSVNQLRGRSIRLDPDEPEKLADNWDVVCIAPEFTKGLDDYHRFIALHRTLYGLTDDGVIEKGVGHVHAALKELKPEGLEGSVEMLDAEMLARPARRAEFRTLWRIGEPFESAPIHAIEARELGEAGGGGFPPFRHSREPWSRSSLAAAVGSAVIESLRDAGLLSSRHRGCRLHAKARAGGYVRLFLERAEPADSALFARSLHEALGPLLRPRYVIPRFADEVSDTWLSKVLPEVVGRYLRRRRRRMAMLHAVPTALAKNKDLAAIYTGHWNRYVSPGVAVYAYQGPGQELLEQARRHGQLPTTQVDDKEVFL